MGVEGPLISAIVIPTHDSAVAETYKILRRLRNGLVPLVDGDLDGNMKVEELRTVAEPPNLVLQWRDAWAIEDTIGWVLKASAGDALALGRQMVATGGSLSLAWCWASVSSWLDSIDTNRACTTRWPGQWWFAYPRRDS